MKKIIFILSLFFLFSANWEGLVFNKVIPFAERNKEKSRKFLFLGIQYSNPFFEWTENGGDPRDIYLPHRDMKKILNAFPQKVQENFRVLVLEKEEEKAFSKMIKLQIVSPYQSYPNKNFQVRDESEAGDFLNEKILGFLNERLSSFYYGVLFLDAHVERIPQIVNGFDFRYTLTLSFLVYNRAGKKIYSKIYTKKDRKNDIKNLSFKDPYFYVDQYTKFLEEKSADIQKDFYLFVVEDSPVFSRNIKEFVQETSKN